MQSKKLTFALLGKSGNGKTAFVNLLYLISQNKQLLEIDHVCVETKFQKGLFQEGNPKDQSKSQTSEPRKLELDLQMKGIHYHVTVIDTPGVVDTDPTKDSEHIGKIRQNLVNVDLNGCLMVKNGTKSRVDSDEKTSIKGINEILGAEFNDSIVYLQTNTKHLNEIQMKSIGATKENTFCYDNFLFTMDWNDPKNTEKAVKKFEKLKTVVQNILEKLSGMKCDMRNIKKFRNILLEIIEGYKNLYKKEKEISQAREKTIKQSKKKKEDIKKKLDDDWDNLWCCVCKIKAVNSKANISEEFNAFISKLSNEIDKLLNEITESKKNSDANDEIAILIKIKNEMEKRFSKIIQNINSFIITKPFAFQLMINLLKMIPEPSLNKSKHSKDPSLLGIKLKSKLLIIFKNQKLLEWKLHEIKMYWIYYFQSKSKIVRILEGFLATFYVPVYRRSLSPVENALCEFICQYFNAQDDDMNGLRKIVIDLEEKIYQAQNQSLWPIIDTSQTVPNKMGPKQENLFGKIIEFYLEYEENIKKTKK